MFAADAGTAADPVPADYDNTSGGGNPVGDDDCTCTAAVAADIAFVVAQLGLGLVHVHGRQLEPALWSVLGLGRVDRPVVVAEFAFEQQLDIVGHRMQGKVQIKADHQIGCWARSHIGHETHTHNCVRHYHEYTNLQQNRIQNMQHLGDSGAPKMERNSFLEYV